MSLKKPHRLPRTRTAALFVSGAAATLLIVATSASAQTQTPQAQPSKTVTCTSTSPERQTCPADTSGGVALQQSMGTGACLLGKTWGYDDKSIWVQ